MTIRTSYTPISSGFSTTHSSISWAPISLDLNNSPEFKQLQEEVGYLSKILGIILHENPEVLNKYSNVKKAFEEYCLFRDLIVNKEDNDKTKI